MSNTLLTVTITLSMVTIITRVGPLFIAKWFRRQPWIGSIANQLPCMILTLLLFHEAEGSINKDVWNAVPVTAGIAVTLLFQYFFKQIILSIGAGVTAYITVPILLNFLGG